MRKWLILLFALPATPLSGAPAWTWVDANGQVHFSDRPVPGAQQIELAGAQGFGVATPPTGSRPDAPAETAPPYESIEIVSPGDQETLSNIGAALTVQVRFLPALQQGHRFDLAIDGQRYDLNTTNPRVTVPNVFRGAHTLEVIVLDSAGTELMRSAVRRFFVRQTSIQNPSNPLRPPPPNPNPPG